MRGWLKVLTAAAALGLPGLAVGQTFAPAPAASAPEGKLRLNYTQWDSKTEEARRWEAPAASAQFGPADARWAETKGGPRSARVAYGLSERSELFVGVTRAKRQDTFEPSRDWKDMQDRKRRAYSIGISTRW
jgi:hypothetical protein